MTTDSLSCSAAPAGPMRCAASGAGPGAARGKRTSRNSSMSDQFPPPTLQPATTVAYVAVCSSQVSHTAQHCPLPECHGELPTPPAYLSPFPPCLLLFTPCPSLPAAATHRHARARAARISLRAACSSDGGATGATGLPRLPPGAALAKPGLPSSCWPRFNNSNRAPCLSMLPNRAASAVTTA